MNEKQAFHFEKFDKQLGFGQLIENAAAAYPEKVAIIFGEKRRTYAQLNERINRLAQGLAAMNLKPDSRIALISTNCPEYLEIVFACAKVGLTVVKINWRLSPREIRVLLLFNEAPIVFFQTENPAWQRELAASLDGSIKWIEFSQTRTNSAYEQLLSAQPSCFTPLPIEGDRVLMHIHTSGTTGIPKPVMYSHRSMLEKIESCIKALGFESTMVFQVMSQLFHSASVGAYMCMTVGGTLVLFGHFDPTVYLESMEREQVTRISAIPTVLKKLLDHPDFDRYDFSTVKTVNYSTCPMSPSLIDQALAKIHCGFMQSYGMTEMGSVVTVLSETDHLTGDHLYSVGKPIPGCQVRVVDEQGQPCAVGQVGEIIIKGPGMMLGYYQMPAETGEAIRNGWYYSKDMGYLDQEGYLFLRGRKSHLIISGGENIYPKEIEDALMEMVEDVAEAAVFGVPDELWGEVVQACIIRKEGSLADEKAVRSFLRDRIGSYKIPKVIHFVSSLPLNSTGKVDRRALQQQYDS